MPHVPSCYGAENADHQHIKRKRDEQPAYATILLVSTLTATTFATGTSCVGLLTDYWEYITWNTRQVREIGSKLRASMKYREISTEPLLNDLIMKITVYDKNATASVYLVPMHGGVWTLCVSLNEEQMTLMKHINFSTTECVNYLWTKLFKEESPNSTNWNNRMQNVSISCALVCLIILVCAALIGAFGIFKNQLSAILVTGVMYLLAGTFALFTIMIAHSKHIDCRRNNQNANEMNLDNDSIIFNEGMVQETSEINAKFNGIWYNYYRAREFNIGWSFDIGITGVVLSMITSIMWILMAKLLRYTSLTTQI